MSDDNSAPESFQLVKNNFLRQIPYPQVNRNLQYVDSEIQLEKIIKPGEPGNQIKANKQPRYSEVSKKMNDKKKEIAKKSSNDKNSGSESMKISSQNSYSAKY